MAVWKNPISFPDYTMSSISYHAKCEQKLPDLDNLKVGTNTYLFWVHSIRKVRIYQLNSETQCVCTHRKRSNNTYMQVKIQEKATGGSCVMIGYSRFSQTTIPSHSLWLQNQFSYNNKPNMAKKPLSDSLQIHL